MGLPVASPTLPLKVVCVYISSWLSLVGSVSLDCLSVCGSEGCACMSVSVCVYKLSVVSVWFCVCERSVYGIGGCYIFGLLVSLVEVFVLSLLFLFVVVCAPLTSLVWWSWSGY